MNGGCALASTTSPDGRSEFLRHLLEIRQDSRVKGLARREAGSLDLAEDALQEAYYAVSQVKNPGEIRNLRAYFCKVLVHEARRLRGQLGAYPVDDVAGLADMPQNMLVSAPPVPPVDEVVCWRLTARAWLESFAAQRAHLLRKVPGRSPDPVRYRQLIVATAERVLLSIVSGDVSEADGNLALAAAYPEWFGGDGCAAGNGHQRFSRARADVCRLVRHVVNPAGW